MKRVCNVHETRDHFFPNYSNMNIGKKKRDDTCCKLRRSRQATRGFLRLRLIMHRANKYFNYTTNENEIMHQVFQYEHNNVLFHIGKKKRDDTCCKPRRSRQVLLDFLHQQSNLYIKLTSTTTIPRTKTKQCITHYQFLVWRSGIPIQLGLPLVDNLQRGKCCNGLSHW